MTDKLTKRKGFTIIEVVIVLAITALIIVIVLLAVQALQRSQRTKANQDAAGRLLQQITNYESALGGNTPIFSAPFLAALPANYITNANLPNNAGTPTMGAGPATTGTRFFYADAAPGGECNVATGAINRAPAPGDTSHFAVSYWSENANAAICIHN